jgi:guanosine-3',5'-bis(diphosphate) 3'-pyrophosphohydrolase
MKNEDIGTTKGMVTADSDNNKSSEVTKVPAPADSVTAKADAEVDLWADLKNGGVTQKEIKYLQAMTDGAMKAGELLPDAFGINPVTLSLQTAQIAIDEIGLKGDAVKAIIAYPMIMFRRDLDTKTKGQATALVADEKMPQWSDGVMHIVNGLQKVHELYKRTPTVESDNFRNLLISFADDIRVILIMIADRVALMRQIRDTENVEAKREVSEEASYLYAPIAHKLGLYKLKSELEDLSLKYLEHDAYYMIKDELNATKRSRDAYIDSFIGPVKERLEQAGLKFYIKGRTKSIHSIWQKMKKQKCGFEGIYDLFAIRIIIDAPMSKEKMLCWQAYSIVTDMYMPNPKRLRDWLSVPKSNGYESLHITVLGPQNKWVEVQIRTQRMDEIAEHGLAAHWRYKGLHGESGIDDWLNNIRTALETGDDMQLMDQFTTETAQDEVYVFTPKGDLYKFPKGATVLDFAYHIHSDVGNKCVGAKINGRNVSIREELHSGDDVEIMTQASQTAKRDWLNIVKTSRAKAKIRLALKETQVKDGLFVKEMIERRLKNRKIEMNEGVMAHLIKRLGFKEMSDFYHYVADEKIEINSLIDKYIEQRDKDANAQAQQTAVSAKEYSYESPEEKIAGDGSDVLMIDRDLKGIDYQLAKCCHPIYGDDIFGFVTVSGGVKIHRTDCPNALEMRRRFGYRIVKAQWSGASGSQYGVTLRVVGTDNIGVVNNITSIIAKEEKIVMRSINIDSNDGIFSGNIEIMLDDSTRLNGIIKKLSSVKGVREVRRI